MKAEVIFEEGKRYKIRWGTNIKGEALYEDAKLEKIGSRGIHYFDNSMCFGIHELDKLEAVCLDDEFQMSAEFNFIKPTKVREIMDSLQEFTEIEKAVLLEDVLKLFNIGIKVHAECTDSGKYSEFQFRGVKLVYDSKMHEKYMTGELNGKYMEKVSTISKLF